MPNGKPGDNPFTDIIIHGIDVYTSEISGLVREIDRLCDDKTRRELGDRLFSEFNPFFEVDLKKLNRELTSLRDKLLRDAQTRGFEELNPEIDGNEEKD